MGEVKDLPEGRRRCRNTSLNSGRASAYLQGFFFFLLFGFTPAFLSSPSAVEWRGVTERLPSRRLQNQFATLSSLALTTRNSQQIRVGFFTALCKVSTAVSTVRSDESCGFDSHPPACGPQEVWDRLRLPGSAATLTAFDSLYSELSHENVAFAHCYQQEASCHSSQATGGRARLPIRLRPRIT